MNNPKKLTQNSSSSNQMKLCRHYDKCGGCSKLDLDYQKQLQQKEQALKELFAREYITDYNFQGLIASPRIYEYRNKMEFSFGDLKIGGKLQLGMHPRGRRFEVVTVDDCLLVEQDFKIILTTIINYFRKQNLEKYHVKRRQGYLRNLIVRKGINTGEILINLVTTSQNTHNFYPLTEELLDLNLDGKLVGFLQTINDDYADTIKCDELINHYGRDYFYEEVLGLKFKIKPFSFFQTNTLGAEQLFCAINNFLIKSDNKLIYDLYCGTGTIAQIVAEKAREVVGIELMEEAVNMARDNAKLNGLNNCTFIAGDVLQIVDELQHNPDVIILDPPRPGIHPEALTKILAFNCPEVIYVSCNPKTLVRDLKEFLNENYIIKQVKSVDMFPHTDHIETCAHLKKERRDY